MRRRPAASRHGASRQRPAALIAAPPAPLLVRPLLAPSCAAVRHGRYAGRACLSRRALAPPPLRVHRAPPMRSAAEPPAPRRRPVPPRRRAGHGTPPRLAPPAAVRPPHERPNPCTGPQEEELPRRRSSSATPGLDGGGASVRTSDVAAAATALLPLSSAMNGVRHISATCSKPPPRQRKTTENEHRCQSCTVLQLRVSIVSGFVIGG